MTIAHNYSALIGTNDTTGVTLANNATSTGSEVDLLGNDTSMPYSGNLYLAYTGTAAAGTIDVYVIFDRVTTVSYSDQLVKLASFVPVNGSQKILVASGLPLARFVKGQIVNNGIGASLTNLFLGLEYWQMT